jgi:NAD(P)-dependent dehydrogenase (short-subunit alcohol dehydrogenase family)
VDLSAEKHEQLTEPNYNSQVYDSPMASRDFSYESTTDDVLKGLDLSGRHFLVTGSSGGLGLETCRSLAAKGASVVMAARDAAKNNAARKLIRETVTDADLEPLTVDLGSLSSTREAAQKFLATGRPLHGLILNAGIMATPLTRTEDGFESQFGVDHLGHFSLAWHLLPRLVESAPARVVILSSAGHRMGDVDLDDVNFERRPYEPLLAYGAAKTCNVLHAVALDHLFKDRGVCAFAVHPGGIHTELGRYMTPEVITSLMQRISESSSPRTSQEKIEDAPRAAGFQWKTIPQGAATTVWAATAPELEGRGGQYCEDCAVSPVLGSSPSAESVNGVGVLARAMDLERAMALWDLSMDLIDK